MKNFNLKLMNHFRIFILILVFGLQAKSQTLYDWQSTAPDGNWKQGIANGPRWNPGGLWDNPNSTSDTRLRFNNNTFPAMTNNVAAGYVINQLFFGSAATTSRSIGGNSVQFFEFGATWPRIENQSTTLHSINFPFSASTNATFNMELVASSGNLDFGSASTITTNGRTVQVYGNNSATDGTNRSIRLGGIVSGTGALNVSQFGVVKLNAAHTYTGQTQIDNGELWIESSGSIAAGSGIFVGNGGQLANVAKFWISNVAGGTTVSNAITINNGNTTTRYLGGLNTSGTHTFSGAITNNSSTGGLYLSALNTGGTTAFTGAISGNNILIEGSGIVRLSGANIYAGTTTVNGGSLQLGAAGVIPDASNVTLNGGTLRSGATTGFSETMGTLNLNANSTIALGTGAHTLTFANSSAVSWAGNQLIITGWAGTYNGASSGTAGKIFIGNSSSGLTSLQWTKIQFFDGTNYFPATQLSTGEVVPTGAIALYWGGTAAQTWTPSATWGTVSGGPYATAWTSGRAAIFNVASSTVTYATTNFASITANENVTVTPGGTAGNPGAIAPIYVASGKTFTFGNQNFSTTAGTGFIKNGPGILQSTNGNAYTGGFTLNDGLISAGGTNAMGAGGPLTINGGTIGANAARNFTGKYTSITVGGDFTLGSSTSPSVGTSNLTFDATTALGSSVTRTITIGGTGTYAWNGVISGTSSNLTIGATAAGSMSLGGINTFGGNFTVNAPSSTVTLAAANTYGGGTVVNAGTLKLSVSSAIPSGSALSFANTSGAILDLSTTALTHTVASLSGGGSTGGNISFGAPVTAEVLTINQSSNTTYSGLISGNGAITKTGSGILTLGHTANTYTGATTISAGELRLNPSTTTGTFASQVVLNGGKLSTTSITAATTFISSSTLQLTASSSIDLGSNAHSLKFAASDGIAWTGATTLTINGWTGSGGATGTAGKIFFGNAAGTLLPAQLSQITFTGFPGTPILLSTGELVPQAVGTPTVSSTSLTSFGNVCISTSTSEQSFTVTGASLTTANVTVGALSGLTYSTVSGGPYSSSLSITQSGGAFSQPIYVVFSPTAVASYNGNIPVGGGGATSINVAAAGSGVNTAPTITTTTVSSITINTASSGGSTLIAGCGTVTAKGIVWNTIINPTITTNLGITSDGSGTSNFTSSISGLSPSTTYYYRSYITNSNGLTSYGTELSFTTPTPTISAGSLTAFATQCIGGTFGPNSFTLTGTNLTASNVTISSLSGYEFSTVSGGPYTSTLSLTQAGGAYSTTIYVRFLPISAVAYSGNIVLGGGGASNINVAASGTGSNGSVAVTTVTASAVSTSTATSGGNTVSTSCGTITAKGVVWGLTANPTVPSVNSTNDGTGTTSYTSNISGLTPGVTYNYRAYATNSNGVTSYGTNSTFTTINFEPSNFPTSFACGTTTSSTIPLTWTDATGANLPGGYLIKWSSTSYGAITDPIDGTAVANGAGVQNVSQGTGSYTLTGLTGLTTYFVKIWSYSNTGTSIDYKLVGEPQTSCATLIAPVALVTWDFLGFTLYGVSPSTAIYTDANLSSVGLTRGSGVGTTPTAAGNAWGGTNWSAATTLSAAVAANSFATFSITPNVGYNVSLNSISAYNIRKSSSGPSTGQWQYQIGSGSFVDIGGPITWGSVTTAAGNNQASIDLSSITALQNVNSNAITFRIVNYNAGAGSWYLNDPSGSAGNDFLINGNVLSIGTLTTSTSVGTTFCAGATGVSVPFTYTPSANFPSGTCTFTAQLSNAAGSFASPVTLQSVTSDGSGSQSISATIPALTSTGSGYRIRIVSASPGVNGSDNASNISISNTATSIAPSTTQNITTSTNGTTLTVTEGTTASSRVWKYGTASGIYGTSTGITTSTYTPNFVLPGTYYIVCVTTYPAPCSIVITSNEVQVNVVGSVDYTWNGSASNDWSNSSNWTPNGVPIIDDNVTFNVPGSNTLVLTDARSINNLTVSGTGTFQLSSTGALSVYASVSNSIAGSPTFDCASNFSIVSASSQTIPSWNFGNLIASGGARVLSSTGTIGICGTFTPGAGAYTNTGSTVNFNGTGAQTVNAFNYNNLTISGAHTTNNITLPAGTIGVAGTFSPTATFSSGTYSNTGNTIDYNGTGAQTVAAFPSYNNLTISGARASAAVTLASGTIGVAVTFNPSATAVTYTSTGNTFDYTSAGSQTIAVFSQYNNLSNSGNGARTLANGIIAVYGTYTPTTAAITVGSSTVDFAGTTGQTIPASFYYNITNSSNTNRTWANAGIIDIKNAFTPTSATNTITGSTIQYSSSTAGLNLTTFTTNVASRNYNNLIFNGTLGTWSLNGNMIGVAGNLTVSAGSLFVGSSGGNGILNVDGNILVNGGEINTTNTSTNGTINLFGNLSVSSGTNAIRKTGGGTGTINFIHASATQTFNQSGGTIASANNWNFGNGTTANTIQIASNVSASTGVFNVNTGTTVDFGTNTLTVTSGAFNLNSGATLNTSNAAGITTAGATGSILRSSGSNTFSAGANYIFGGAITGTGFTGANNLTINNASGVTLSAAATVNGSLTFTNGLLDIAAVNLTIGSSGSIAGANSTKYVKTSGTGQLKMTVAASNVLFPVGRSAYNPLTLNNSGTSDVFGVFLADAISQALNNASLVVNRSWNITETVAGGSSLSIVSQWNGAAEQAAGFAGGTTPRIAYWNGSAWVQTGATQAGANPFTYTSAANLTGIASATYSIAIGKDDAFNCTSVPTVSLILPTSGYSGDVITINGTGLTGLTSASIGGSAATILSQSGTSATLSVGAGATGVITVSKSALCSASGSQTFTYNGFISAQTGNWSLGSTWQGGVVPPDLATVTIANSHVVTVDDLTNPASVIINAGAELTGTDDAQQLYVGSTGNGPVSVTGTLSLGTALVSSGWLVCGTLSVNNGGVFNNNCEDASAAGANVTSLTLASGATYNHNALGSTLNGTLSDFPGLTGGTNISINSSANVNITRWAQNTGTPSSLPSVSGGQWGNLTVNISGLTYSGSWQNSGILTNATSLNIVNTGTRDFRLVTPTGTAGFTSTIGSVNVSGGIFVLIGGGSTGSGVVTMNVTNDFNVSGGVASIHGSSVTQSYNTTGVTLNVGGNLNITGGSFYGHANSLFNTAAVSSSLTTLNVTGNLSIDNGIFNLAYLPNYNFAGNTGNVNLNVKGNFTLGTTGVLRNSNSIAPLGKTTATVNFNHASAQQTWTQTGAIQDVIGFNVNGTANTLQLLSDAYIGTSTTSAFNVANATTFDIQAFVLSGSGAFTSAAGSTLKLGNSNGITTIPTLSGNVQLLTSRTFNAATNYIYSGTSNQVTGNALPSNITGAFTIANTGASSNNTVTLSTTGTTASTFNLTSGLFAAGTGQQLNIASGGTVNATSGDFATGLTTGILNFPGTGTFTGNSNPFNVFTSGGVNFGSGTVTIQPAGTFRINTGGFVSSNAPFYASGSTLQYYTTGVYGRNLEWRASSGRGYPHHVQVSNSTTLNPGANSNTGQPFNTGGNLTIDAGSNIYMDYTALNMTVPLSVIGGLNLNGNLSLSGVIGGDINVGGDWINNGTTSNFNPNNRAVSFNGGVNQNIGGTNTSSNPFAYVTINNSSGVTLTYGQQINNQLSFSNGTLSLGNFDLIMNGLNIPITGYNNSKFIVTNGSGNLYRNFNSVSTVYPVGPSSTSYNPLTLNQLGTPDNIGVRVATTPSYSNSINDNNQMVLVEYFLSEVIPGDNNLITSFQWNATNEGSTFNRSGGVYQGNWNGFQWVVRPSLPTSGSNPYTSTSTVNYTGNLINTSMIVGNINGIFSCISTSSNGSWNDSNIWLSGIVPPADASVCINHPITLVGSDVNIANVTINPSGSLTIDPSINLNIADFGGIVNNSGATTSLGQGNVVFTGIGSVSGLNPISIKNLTLNGNTTLSATPTIDGNLTFNSGAYIIAGSPTYSATSTLIYSTGGNYTSSNEWNANASVAGLGTPQNVLVNGTNLSLASGNRGLLGDLTISSGALSLNTSSGDLYVGGNWNRNSTATFNSNNRAVIFTGATNQTITINGGGNETFTYLIANKTAGNLVLNNSPATNVIIGASSGNVLEIASGNTIDLNGQTLSLTGTGGNINLPSGIASITGSSGSVFSISNGLKTITPSLGASIDFGTNVTVALNSGFNFGAATSTINGTLQMANGGFVSTNAPTYAAGSTLRYYTGNSFNRGLEWSTISGPGYPHHVVVDLNSTVTTVNLAPGSSTCQLAGNLSINNGAIVNMGAMTNPLVVLGDVNIGGSSSGTLSLSSAAGGDINIGGNLTRNAGGTLTQNSREVEMNGSITQNISGVPIFSYLAINNSAASVKINDNTSINNRLRLSNGVFDLNSLGCTLAIGSKIVRVNGTMSAYPTVFGSNVYDIEYQNSVISGFEYSDSLRAVRDVIVTAGNTLTLGANRTFNRDLTLSGGDLNLGGYTLTARGRATAPAFSGSITVSGGGVRSITGPAGSTFDITGLGANLPNDYTKTVSSFGGSTLSFDSNVLVRIGDGAVDFGAGSPTTINGTLQVLLGGSVGQVLNPCYYGVNSLLRFSNTVDYQIGSNDKTWASGSIASGNPGIPYNVEVMDVNTDLQLQSTRALRGNLTITDGTFTLTPAYTGSFNIGGNWSRSGATSAFNHNSKKVVFDRQTAGSQTLTVSSGVSTETFYDLEISLLSGNLVSPTSSAITINNNLNFVSGKIDLGSNRLTIGTSLINGTITGASSSNYVITNAIAGGGNIKAFTNSNATYNFPVGDVTNYSPMSVTLTNGAQVGSYITTTTVQGAHPNMLTGTPPTKYISRYWSVEPTGLAINPVYNVSYSYVAADEVGTGTLYPVKYSTSTTTPGWLSCPGSTASAVTGTSGANDNVLKTFTWNGLTTFSDFSGAGDGSPLPVTWLNFDAQFNNATNNVDVTWTTASEINNDYFEILRSNDAVNFNVIGTVDGAGNSSLVKEYAFEDTNPLEGISYYKVRQVDFNGIGDYTEIRAVSNLGGIATGTLFAYPNPLIGQDLTIVYSNLDKGNWEYRLFDITGKIVLSQNRNSDLNAGKFTLNLEQLPAGVYLFQLNTQSQNFTRKITISK